MRVMTLASWWSSGLDLDLFMQKAKKMMSASTTTQPTTMPAVVPELIEEA
jgi:hypothetical protein